MPPSPLQNLRKSPLSIAVVDCHSPSSSESEYWVMLRPTNAHESDETGHESLDAAPKVIVKSFTHSLTGKTYTITLIRRVQSLKKRIAAALGVIMSECDFVWHAHSFAFCQTLRMLRLQPFAAYSFQHHPPPAHVVPGLEFSYSDLFGTCKRKRNISGRFVRDEANTPVCEISAATLACTGGSAVASWLAFALVTGTNFPQVVHTQRIRMHEQNCEQDCKVLLSRR
jgi:hypothetical protein